MLSAYPACFIREENGYSVIFPDLNYLSTCGKTLDESLTMAVDCLAVYLFWCEKNGDVIPAPSTIDKIVPSHITREFQIDCSESFVNMVTVDVTEYAKTHFEKSVKKTLTIPSWLNKAAIEHDINFSQVLQDALKAKLHIKNE